MRAFSLTDVKPMFAVGGCVALFFALSTFRFFFLLSFFIGFVCEGDRGGEMPTFPYSTK